MRKAIFFLVFLTACATRPSPDVTAYRDYITQIKPQAEYGTVKWSDYFSGLYQKAVAIPTPPWHLRGVNNLLSAALKYERGEISREDFDRIRREETISAMEQGQAQLQRETAEQRAREQAASSALLATGVQLLQSGGPQVIGPVKPQPQPLMVPMGFLKSQSTTSTLRICTYSNGVVKTVSIVDLCAQTTQ